MDALIISNALDTNGQNARYMRASEHWGSSPDVLKALAIGHYDPASVVGRFQAAADKSDALRIRSVHRAQHIYQQMPADIVWTRANQALVKKLAEEADILHLNNSTVALRRLGLRRGKPMLLHHHGSLFRNNPMHQLGDARNYRATQAVSTVDLMRMAPEQLHWLPTAYDVDWLVEFGDKHRRKPDGMLRIVQAPTDGKESPYKSTPALERAVANLKAQGMDIELLIIRDKPWIECMALKATADIYFDQVKLGYGCNAVEAWGMGIPVIAGGSAWTLAKMREEFGTKALPFYIAEEDTIEAAILALADKRTHTTYAKRGMAHIRKFHDELPALTRLAALYRKAIENRDVPQEPIKMEPVTFIAKVKQMSFGGRYVNFPYTTDNPHRATQMRVAALRYPGRGIEEVA